MYRASQRNGSRIQNPGAFGARTRSGRDQCVLIHISIMFNKQLQSDGFIFTQNLSFPRSHEEMHTELSWGACAFRVRAPQAGSWGSQGCSSAHRTVWGSPGLACTPMAPLHLQRGALRRQGPASPTSPRSLDPSLLGSLEPQPSSSSAFPSGRS